MPFLSRSEGYQSIPSVIPEHTRKTSLLLEGVLETWDDRDEIKHHEGSNGQTSYYYSDSQQPEGLLESGRRFFTHLVNPEKQASHRQAIDAVVKELKETSALRTKGVIVEKKSKIQRALGQPFTVGALRQSLATITPQTLPTTNSSLFPPSPFSIFGKHRKPEDRESIFKTVTKDLKRTFSFSRKNDYDPIPERDSIGQSTQQNGLHENREFSSSYQNLKFQPTSISRSTTRIISKEEIKTTSL